MKIVLIVIGALAGLYATFGMVQLIDVVMTSDSGNAYSVAHLAASVVPVVLGILICLVCLQKAFAQRTHWKWAGVAIVLVMIGLAGLGRYGLHSFYAEDSADSWTYRSPVYGFSMTLPSSDWKEVKKQDADVAFHNRKHSVLVGVNVMKGQQGLLQKSIRGMQEMFERGQNDLLSKPQLTEGTTEAGNPYTYWTVLTKANQEGEVLFARSFVFCRDKELIVSVIMEAPLAMQSKLGKEAEQAFFHNAVKTICLSIE